MIPMHVKCSTLTFTLSLLLVMSAGRDGIAQNANSSIVKSLDNARIDSVDFDHGSVVLTDCPISLEAQRVSSACAGQHMTASVANDAKPQLKFLHPGDHAKVVFQTEKSEEVASIVLRTQPFSPFWRFLVLALAYLATFLLATLLTRGHPFKLVIGADNRYSNSQFQMALWFSVLISTYIAMIVLRVLSFGWEFWGGVDLPVHLLALSGASAITFGAAKGITTSKVQAAQAAGIANAKPAGTPHFLLDLVSNDTGGFDLGDFQMLVITLLAVATYVVTVFQFFASIECLKTASLCDVDTTILSAFGLGQGAYLTKKAAGNPGTS